ncbi:glycine betaine ABC transporter substrate-binding protein [Salinilacustrithrix flava]|uniref:glycine betaine ABC transporter substrate-binding protein n=1 Tax=Salinilacustrithrix flava TaxID=2957203 RepID=UPI003D7C1B9B
MRMQRNLRLLGALLALALFVAACGDDDAETTAGDDPATEEAAGDGGTIEIGMIPWDEDIAVTHLWTHILEEQGYTVETTQLDAAPTFQGLAAGDLDVFLDAWLPSTHEDYWDEYGDELEDLGTWYDQGTLNLAVPSYVDVDTIGDLAGQAEMFDGQIIGIEPGAGLTRVTREEAMPGYGLEGYTLVEGSTPAMLAELERALDNEEPVVVTLWHPHWAYAAYDIKDLEDPDGLMGGAEELHAVARSGFSEEFPEVAEWFGSFELTDDQLASLEDLMFNTYDSGQEAEAVDEWLQDEANADVVESWIS